MYEITITKTETVKKLVGKDWVKLGQIEKKREPGMYSGHGPDDAETYLSDDYGYSPETEKHVEVTRQIYRQEVDELDLTSVINAVNK